MQHNDAGQDGGMNSGQTPPPRRYHNEGSRFAQRSKRRETHWLLWALGITLVLAVLLRLFVIQSVMVSGPSMEPTLYRDEMVVVEKLSYRFSSPQHQQVVVFVSEPMGGQKLIKRVIAIAGDSVEIKDGLVYVNDERIEDRHAAETANYDMERQIVPQGHIFVMGDNRNNSSDSRAFGPVPLESVIGRAWFVLWPVSKWGGV